MSDENVETCARALLNAKLAMDDPTIIATVLVPEVEWDALRSALARASRPREAGSGDRAKRVEDAAELLLNRLWTHAILHCATHANKIGSPHIDGCRCDPAVSALRCALDAPPVAPEACPVAVGSASFGVVDCDGNLYADSHRDAERRVSILNGSDIAGKPYRVVPLYAQPTSATAEGGGGDTKRAADGGTPAALSHPGLLGQSRLGSSDHTTEPLWVERDGKRVWSEGWQANRGVPYTPGMLDTLRFYAKDHFDRVQAYNDDPKRVGPEKCPESVWVMADRLLAAFPATPASAAGREGAFGGYERERAAFDAWWADKSDGFKRATAKGANLSGVAWDAYYARALLAAEAAERGEKEA